MHCRGSKIYWQNDNASGYNVCTVYPVKRLSFLERIKPQKRFELN